MDNFVKRFLSVLLVSIPILLVIFVASMYIVLQNKASASWISHVLSQHSGYNIRIGSLKHSFSDPLQLVLRDVTIEDTQHELLKADRILLKPNSIRSVFFQGPYKLKSVTIENGRLDLQENTLSKIPINSQRLELKNVFLTWRFFEKPLEVFNINMFVTAPDNDYVTLNNGIIQFSAQRFKLGTLSGLNSLIQGRLEKNRLIIESFGASFPKGSISAKQIERTDTGDWSIERLYMNNIRWQTEQTFENIIENAFPNFRINIKQFEAVHADLEGADWAFNQANLKLDNIEFGNGIINKKQGDIAFSAKDMVYKTELLTEPELKLTLNNDGIQIINLKTYWNKGSIQTSGLWRHNYLQLDEVALQMVEYSLPPKWLSTLLNNRTPEWLDSLVIIDLIANRNILIDVSPRFPFQIAGLDIEGNNIQLVKNHEFGIWDGRFIANANSASFNRIDLRLPTFTMTAGDGQIQLSDMTAFMHQGLLEGKMSLQQDNSEPATKENFFNRFAYNLDIIGKNIPIQALELWGWGKVIPSKGNGNISLTLNKSTANKVQGRLRVVNEKGNQLIQTLP